MVDREVLDLSVRFGGLSLRVRSSPQGPSASRVAEEPSSPATSQGSFELVVHGPAGEPVDCPPLVRRSRRGDVPATSSALAYDPNPRTPARVQSLPLDFEGGEPPNPSGLGSSPPSPLRYPLQAFGPGQPASGVGEPPIPSGLGSSFPSPLRYPLQASGPGLSASAVGEPSIPSGLGSSSSSPLRYPLQASGPGQPAPVSVTESREKVRASFPPISPAALSLGRGLAGGGAPRAERAWLAGLWAGAVLADRVSYPDRTPQLDLRNRFYIVLRAPGLESPQLFSNFSAYRNCVRDHTGGSVSHGFPSQAECRIYCAAAGLACPDLQ